MKSWLIVLLVVAPLMAADSGILIPSTATAPDPKVLSLGEMTIDIGIDDNTARVSVQEIFANHTARSIEGTYNFALPQRAVLSDFAVWDDVVRIPGVILERKRAEETYDSFRNQSIDPGLLQMGEGEPEEASRTSTFSARIAPIPADGTKRIELEYHERVPIEQLLSVLSIPLKPDVYQAQVAGRLQINVDLRSERALAAFSPLSKTYPLQISEQSPNHIRAAFSGQNITLAEDLTLQWTLAPTAADTLRVITYRNPTDGAGFFQASALFGSSAKPADAHPRTVIAVFDTSLSMQWDKLNISYQTLETLLRSLRRTDRFNIVAFNSDVSLFAPAPQLAGVDPIERALSFVKQSRLRGGTDLGAALSQALDQAQTQTGAGGDTYVVVLSDGGATQGTVQSAKLFTAFQSKWSQRPVAQRPRMFVLAVGDDANIPLMKRLGNENGVFDAIRSTEPAEFKIREFIAKIGRFPIGGLQLTATPAGNTSMIYPLEPVVFDGSAQTWIGEYKQPAAAATFVANGQRDAKPVVLTTDAALPAKALDHPSLPRTWAKARVDALLDKIDRAGEDRASIEEIIRLSRKYKFVTPYTSFLAAPRALLRPRLIQPGDPVLRVKTDPAIESVIAVFPFGLIKALKHLDQDDVWQTRFIAPADMADGTHPVQIVMRDRSGHAYQEEKTFIIASKAPVVRVKLDKTEYRRAETMRIQVAASGTTRTLIARTYGVAPVTMHWNAEMHSNTGLLQIPQDLPLGRYSLNVTAEDFAHNIGSAEVTFVVLP